MQLEQISANIRERTLWEGADLGFVMARQWFFPLWRLWWLIALPLLAITLLLLHKWPFAVAFIVWWCKPAYEPMLLFWLSRRLFGEELTVKDTLAQWRRIITPRLLANLTVRRLSLNRSFYMPVSHLEGLTGAARQKRLEVLSGGPAAGMWLTVVGAHLEGILEFSLLFLLFYLIPDELQQESLWTFLGEEGPLITWLSHAFWVLAMSIIAPFYVAAGFALYLTRRSQLEAWDLELTFRRVAARIRNPQTVVSLLLTMLLCGALALPSGDARASEPPPLTREEARQAIDQVLGHEDFGKKQTEQHWKYIGKKSSNNQEGKKWDFSWAGDLAQLLELLLWLGGGVLLAWLALTLKRILHHQQAPAKEKALPAPSVLFGLPVTPESLPEDIAATIQALLAEQRLRAALSLLYRATLSHLIHDHHLRIPDSATEGECVQLVTISRPQNEAGFFLRLNSAWTWCAYGNTPPAVVEVQHLIADWQQLYGTRSDE